jgi:hypothetical protein
MKKMITILCLLGFFSPGVFLRADVYVKGIMHIAGGYRLGHIVPDIDAVNEWWFAEDKVTFITSGWFLEFMGTDWRFTLDKEKKRILVVNLNKKTYTEVSLEKDPLFYVEPPVVKILSAYHRDGTVIKKEEKKNFFDKTCDVYQVSEWLMEVDLRTDERERIIYVTTDVPFNWRLFNELFQWIRSYHSPYPTYVSQLQTIDGFIVKFDETFLPRGGRQEWDFKVLEISRKEAPGNIYDIPGDYKALEKFSTRDIFDLDSVVYPNPIY